MYMYHQKKISYLGKNANRLWRIKKQTLAQVRTILGLEINNDNNK